MRIWSDVEYVFRCLADTERTLAFQSAIQAAVKPGDVVLDLGTGSGILAIFAADAGARRVYAVEIGSYLSQISQQIFQQNGYGDRIVPLRMDARAVTLDCIEKPDVVICEMITTGLIGEMQGVVINALKKAGVIDLRTVLVPASVATTVALVSADFNRYSAELRFPIFVNYFTRGLDSYHEILSEEKTAHAIDFSFDFSEVVGIHENLHVTRGGRGNGLLLKSVTGFTGSPKFGASVSYCQPVILPISDLVVAEGDTVTVSLEYRISEGFDSLKCDVSRQNTRRPPKLVE